MGKQGFETALYGFYYRLTLGGSLIIEDNRLVVKYNRNASQLMQSH